MLLWDAIIASCVLAIVNITLIVIIVREWTLFAMTGRDRPFRSIFHFIARSVSQDDENCFLENCQHAGRPDNRR